MPSLNDGAALDTGVLEYGCRWRNEWCSGEMHRYYLEHQLRRQVTKIQLTLMDESVGSEQD